MDHRCTTAGLPFLLVIYLLPVLISGKVKNVLEFNLPRDEVTVFMDESLFVTCKPPPAASVSRIMWISPKNDVVQDHGRIHVEQSNEVNGLDIIFQNIQHSDKGLYTCGANVDGEEVSRMLKVQVLKPITFVNTPATQSASEGSNYVIRCYVEGDPEPTLTLKPVNHDRSQSLKNRYNRTEDGLLISNISRGDAGEYRCTALQINVRRTDIREMVIYFSVKFVPEWVPEVPDTFFSYVSGNANITCEAKGEPTPEYRWYRHDQLINSDSSGTSGQYFIYNSTDGRSVLRVNVFNESDFGKYVCEAFNEMGFIRREISLLIGEKPQIPFVNVKRYHPSSIELDIKSTMVMDRSSEDEPKNENGKLLGYRVLFKSDEQGWEEAGSVDFMPGESYTIRNLEPDKTYVVRVAARNIAGFGDFSEDIQQRTLNDRGNDSDSGLMLSHSHTLGLVMTLCASITTFILA
ncbi:hypothetical protein CHUAL_001666 [Chamberlinius hualienensis]